ncbi:MAG: transposase [Planctomycetota bacterium]
MSELHFFDRNEEFSVIQRQLPHWVQPGVISFITLRLADSMPKDVVTLWREQRAAWLRRWQIDPFSTHWREHLSRLDHKLQREFYRTFSQDWHLHLDACHGDCVLRDHALAKIVGDSLLHGNGERYELTDFVIMPNHVHLLASFRSEEGMLKQCESWKRWTARQINRRQNRNGRFWQQDGFDHLVRSEEQFQHFRRYIANNPRKARLKNGEFLHWSRSES